MTDMRTLLGIVDDVHEHAWPGPVAPWGFIRTVQLSIDGSEPIDITHVQVSPSEVVARHLSRFRGLPPLVESQEGRTHG